MRPVSTFFRSARAILAAVLLAAALLTGGPGGAAAAGYRIAVMEATPPFSYRAPDGRLTGFNVEIMRALCRVMDATCTFVELPFQAVLDAVAEERCDVGLANFLRTPDREARVDFSAPYWRSSSSFIGPMRDAAVPGPEAVRGRSVAVIRTTRQHAYMERMAGDVDQLVTVASLEDLWRTLTAGEAEFALVPTLAGLDFLLTHDGRAFSTIGTPLAGDGLGGTVHLVVPKGRRSLLNALNGAITTIRADGSYQEIGRRYFPFDVY
ncbi:substrate-binding periplasmic protein [Azospirillum halopraeferens]|uniref:substrate-binding periplasmic protein n=1 Tax=Azospirillum halopraeferens TaxID=34010 RepID=UPI000402D4C0|nr:transporter substrate-binding domain-containing protein [Azospirillum halopraeferens]